jgi:periplasmic protein TonB
MGHPATVEPPPVAARTVQRVLRPATERKFTIQLLPEHDVNARRKGGTFLTSLVVHAILIACVILIPLLFFEEALPAPGEVLRAFFVQPAELAPPPPPPPPPPAAGARPVAKAPAAPRPTEPAKFVAPIEVPEEIRPDDLSLDLGGAEGGVAGGVEGGVPGGVLGGIVGGLPQNAAPPPAPVVRVGGSVKPPKLVKQVAPEYPALAMQARLQAVVIVEAYVGTDGRVKSAKVLRGAPLFDDPALSAVRQWRYAPLLLNGVPTEFVLTVTLNFKLQQVQVQQ